MKNYLVEEEPPKDKELRETFLHAPALDKYPFLKWLLPLLLALFIVLLGIVYLF